MMILDSEDSNFIVSIKSVIVLFINLCGYQNKSCQVASLPNFILKTSVDTHMHTP